ncbi:MAG: bifunctional shikimate kinase/3-dehydroquinate synthase [Deltaproteobacteria bacterium]|jgi:3-dehydroquinate synthetase|nr:bifunctional shikimate kinase/3-dehydroquinate synthase [Deltaproteobacteria bacterium]
MHVFPKNAASPDGRNSGAGKDPPGDQTVLPPERHVFLSGFMGAGKSTVGPILAGRLGRPFTDLDREIEEAEGISIRDIFADPEKGEGYFRKREAEKVKALIASRGLPRVIALGGGAVEDPQTRKLLAGSANTFFLDAGDPEILWERACRDAPSRPLAGDRAGFMRRLERRLPLYRASGLPVDAGGAGPEEVCDRIVKILFCGREAGVRASESWVSRITAWPDAAGLAASLAGRLEGRRVLMLLDPALRSEEAFWQKLLGSGSVVYPEKRGEAAKTLASAEKIMALLAARSFDRSDWLLVRGGGSLTDLGGFCAGLFKRGIRLLMLPTTLLAAVDAAVGGKTAVNFAGAKNQCGHFYLPEEVLIEGEILRRLPRGLLEEGLSEAYKTGLVRDPVLSDLISREIESLLPARGAPGPDLPLLLDCAWRGASLKASVCSEDFRERKGVRDVLNFGHTFGHAVEAHFAASEIPVPHGRAVAFGMAAALVLSERSFGLDPDAARRARAVCLRLSRGGYPPIPPEDELERLFLTDKKARLGKLKFVALKAPGEPEVADLLPGELVSAAREAVREATAREIVPWSMS